MTDDEPSKTNEMDGATDDEANRLTSRREVLQAVAFVAIADDDLTGPNIPKWQQDGAGVTGAESTGLVPRQLVTSVAGEGATRFGTAVDLADGTAIVGRPPNSDGAPRAIGKVAVLSTESGGWSRQTTLEPEAETDDGDFGAAVSIDGDTAVVGAPLSGVPAGPHGGSATVFERSDGGWREATSLRRDVTAGVDRFGASVSVNADTAIVGAPTDTTERGFRTGSASVFSRSDESWSREQTLIPPEGIDHFGRAVALNGDVAVVGARQTESAPLDSGVAFVYERSGGRWSLQAKLGAGGSDNDDGFGTDLAIERDRILVGAPTATTAAGANAGKANVFVRSAGTWTQEGRLLDENGMTNDQFGSAVALSNGTALVGGKSIDGPVVFTRSAGLWTRELTLPGQGKDGRRRRVDVALDGGRALVGSDTVVNGPGRNEGLVEVFEP